MKVNLEKLVPVLARELPNLGNEEEWEEFLVAYPAEAVTLSLIWEVT